MNAPLTILGIESSCDDTAAAIVRGVPGQPVGEILSANVSGQADLHGAFGGVVPEIAARAHAEVLDLCVEEALAASSLTFADIDHIAVTAGPGLIGGVISGVLSAKGLGATTGLPVIGVNHLVGHALTPRLISETVFPYLILLVSGGHCQFIAALGPDEFQRLGGTIDDAPGEAFDKTARLLGLGYPGGPAVEIEAATGNPDRFDLPRPLLDRPGCDMSFSGLKTALRRERDKLIEAKGGITRADRADLCAGFQAAISDVLGEKTKRALDQFVETFDPPTRQLAVAGGVAANQAIRQVLEQVAVDRKFDFIAPPLSLCTDNAAMIAWAGIEQLAVRPLGELTDFAPRPRWPLDRRASPMLGSGKKGAKA